MKIKSLVDIEKTGIRDYREITVTSKRQITIPKLYFDHLQIHDTLEAYLVGDGIYLKPKKMQNIYTSDLRQIVLNTIREGYDGEELANEVVLRIEKYTDVLNGRISEFDDGDGVESLNGFENYLR